MTEISKSFLGSGFGISEKWSCQTAAVVVTNDTLKASPNSVALRTCPAESSFTAYSGTSMRTNAPVSLTNAAAAVSTPQMTHTNNDARVALSAREYKSTNTNIDNRHNVINILSDNAKCAWLSKALSRATATDSVNARKSPATTARRMRNTKTGMLLMHDLYPPKEALDGALASGSVDGTPETLDQLDELLVTLGASVGRS
jgi:hypothetical protein